MRKLFNYSLFVLFSEVDWWTTNSRKSVISNCKSDRQYKVQTQRDKKTHNRENKRCKQHQKPQKTGDELLCSGVVCSFCIPSCIRRVTLVENLLINNERKSYEKRKKVNKVMTVKHPKWCFQLETLGSIASSLAATLFHVNPDGNQKLCGVVSNR